MLLHCTVLSVVKAGAMWGCFHPAFNLKPLSPVIVPAYKRYSGAAHTSANQTPCTQPAKAFSGSPVVMSCPWEGAGIHAVSLKGLYSGHEANFSSVEVMGGSGVCMV